MFHDVMHCGISDCERPRGYEYGGIAGNMGGFQRSVPEVQAPHNA